MLGSVADHPLKVKQTSRKDELIDMRLCVKTNTRMFTVHFFGQPDSEQHVYTEQHIKRMYPDGEERLKAYMDTLMDGSSQPQSEPQQQQQPQYGKPTLRLRPHGWHHRQLDLQSPQRQQEQEWQQQQQKQQQQQQWQQQHQEKQQQQQPRFKQQVGELQPPQLHKDGDEQESEKDAEEEAEDAANMMSAIHSAAGIERRPTTSPADAAARDAAYDPVHLALMQPEIWATVELTKYVSGPPPMWQLETADGIFRVPDELLDRHDHCLRKMVLYLKSKAVNLKGKTHNIS